MSVCGDERGGEGRGGSLEHMAALSVNLTLSSGVDVKKAEHIKSLQAN